MRPSACFVTGASARGARTLAWISVLIALAGAPLLAQQTMIPVTGRITDAAEHAVVGFRLVIRAPGTGEIYLSQPTDEEGSYRLEIPQGTNCAPVAAFSPDGRRVALEETTPRPVLPGLRFDVVLPLTVKPATNPRPFDGADRLFLSFVEDVAFVSRERFETDLTGSGYTDSTSLASQFLAAFGFTALPRMEFGARIGYAGTNFDAGGGAAGATDLDAWGKFYLGSSLRHGTRWAVGALLTFPTGDEDTGLGYGVLRSKLFGSVRFDVGRFTVSANAGVRISDSTTVGGVELDGTVAGALAGAALYEVNHSLVAVGEVSYEGESYEGAGDDGRLLFGVNWKPIRPGFFRLAVDFGLADASPDAQLLGGWVFEF